MPSAKEPCDNMVDVTSVLTYGGIEPVPEYRQLLVVNVLRIPRSQYRLAIDFVIENRAACAHSNGQAVLARVHTSRLPEAVSPDRRC